LAFNFDRVGIWLPRFYEQGPPHVFIWPQGFTFGPSSTDSQADSVHCLMVMQSYKQRLFGLLPLRHCSSLYSQAPLQNFGV